MAMVAMANGATADVANGAMAVSYGAPRPKPPLNAYANFHKHFCATDEYKDALKAMGPTKAVGAPMQLTSKAWAELSAAEKNIWQADAKAAKAAYNLEHYGEQPKEKRARRSSSDSDSGGGAPKTAKAKFLTTETDIEHRACHRRPVDRAQDAQRRSLRHRQAVRIRGRHAHRAGRQEGGAQAARAQGRGSAPSTPKRLRRKLQR